MTLSPTFSFNIVHQSKRSRARVGQIVTPHGVIDTPNFVAVGTNATLKALDSLTVTQLGLQLMFCNTYHLMVQPGTNIVKKAGGLHRFIGRTLPLITDSGGFQVFSLAYGGVHNELKSKGKRQTNNTVMSVTEEGVIFRSYRDGTPIVLTPESSILAQKDLGADIIIPLDELLPYHIDAQALEASFNRTHRWQKRSFQTHVSDPAGQAMYAVIHGNVNKELRKASCDFLTKLDFDGFAIGGSLGKTKEEMFDLLAFIAPLLPTQKPNHLLGIGDMNSIDIGIPLGIDTFDSSYPTRCARHGLLFTLQGHTIKVLSSANRDDFTPPDPLCRCFTCTNYSRAYLHHLFKAHEMTGYTLATIHNVHTMITLMQLYREKILNDEI